VNPARHIRLAFAPRMLAGLLCLASSACRNTLPPRDGHGRQWFAVAGSMVERDGDQAQDVDEAGAFTLEGGYDVLTTEYLRAGFEVGFNWSSHDVRSTSTPGESWDLYVARWSMGARAGLMIPAIDGVLYVNGGFFLRDEDADDWDVVAAPPPEESGTGLYIGGGLDFWFDRVGRMGPFVRYYDDSDSDVHEMLIGLSVTFCP
jgi:hypothetical protein